MMNIVTTTRTNDWKRTRGIEQWCEENGYRRTAWDGFSSIYTRVSTDFFEKMIIICINE